MRRMADWTREAKVAMVEQGITTTELARRLNLSRPYTSSVLNGRILTPGTVRRISDELGIVPDGIEDLENER